MKTQMKMVLVAGASALALLSGASAQLVAVNAGSDGFTGWTQVINDSQRGQFLGESGTIDTTGLAGIDKSWALYANSGQTVENIYSFGTTLVPGNYVEISISLGGIQEDGVVGISLQNSSGANRFETYYRGEDPTDAFKLNDADGEENISDVTTTFVSSSWSNSNFQVIRFTLGSSNTYSLSFNGVSVGNTGLTITASDISRIRLFNFNAGPFDPANQYFNNLTVVPEPGTYLAMGFAVLLVVFVARRRREA